MIEQQLLQVMGLKARPGGKTDRYFGQILRFPVEATGKGRRIQLAFTHEGQISVKVVKLGRQLFKENELTAKRVTVYSSNQAVNLPQGAYFCFTLNFPEGNETAFFQQFLQVAGQMIREAEFSPPCQCALCSQSGGDQLAAPGGVLTPVHHACLNSWAQENSADDPVRGNAFLGLIGGFLGGLVGILPTLLSLYFVNTMYSVLYMLIPLAIFYGWRLLGGPRGRLVTAFTVIYSLVQIFVLDLAYTYILFRPVAIHRVIDFVLDNYVELYLMDAVYGLVFVVIGIAAVWTKISGNAQTDKANVELVVAQAVPLDTAQAEAVGE